MPIPTRSVGSALPTIRHEECWAKTSPDGTPRINALDHCLNVGCVAEALVQNLPASLRKLLPPGVVTLAALHDIGKVSLGFQAKCDLWRTKYGVQPHQVVGLETDHAKISQFTITQLLSNSSLEKWAAIVGAHHGKLKGRPCPSPWEEERRRLAEELIKQFGHLPDHPASDAVLWFAAGLITVADWIGSDETQFPDQLRTVEERRQHALRAVNSLGWKPIVICPGLSFAELFPNLKEPNSLQSATLESVKNPGVYLIEGPMGFGKTEAALAAAYRLIAAKLATGLYFALPTQVTSNRIHERVQPFVDRICAEAEPVHLAHSGSWLVETKPPLRIHPASPDGEAAEHVRAGRSWFATAKRALLAPFGVGTIDQALLGIVAANHFFVRQFGLAGKVVILDEVHTYDLYTSMLIGALIKRLRELECTVIVLSATLTEARRRELLGLDSCQPVSTAYPLVSGVADSFIERTCEPPPSRTVRIRSVKAAPPVADALAEAQRGACVLWIRNTVDEAQETYRVLQSANCQGGPAVALLHSRFPFFRREELETDWMNRLGKDGTKRPLGCVLVSTQVCEQSVDIDADLLITDLAPTDMLLQRLGRLWRHQRPTRPCPEPEVWIQIPSLDDTQLRAASEKDLRQALGKSGRVYAPYVLLRSLQQWRERATITLPNDIRAILEATYADPAADEPLAWQKLREQLEKQKNEMARQALNATNVWSIPALPDEEGIQTRWNNYPMAQLLLAHQITRLDAHTVRLELLNGDIATASGHDWNFNAAKAIHRNLTRLPRWAVSAFLSEPPAWLMNHVEQPTAVGLVSSDGTIYAMDGRTDMGLSYHPDEGVLIHRDRRTRPPQEDDEYFD
ncbi:MAG: CRISPR-associated helicase Cas3' [Verrucomicrobiae bacterium]|nr:CRISPR-associated helicase Cas3' [Verrucomicrobiae bacterium]